MSRAERTGAFFPLPASLIYFPELIHNVQQEHPVNQFQHIIVKASGSLKYKGMDMQTDGKRKREKDREGGSKSAQEYISLDVIKSGERQAGASI